MKENGDYSSRLAKKVNSARSHPTYSSRSRLGLPISMDAGWGGIERNTLLGGMLPAGEGEDLLTVWGLVTHM